MPSNITPQKMQEAVALGFRQTANFRRARLLFLRNYVGQYYDRERGTIGDEPLNMIFNAIRVLVPNLVMTAPKHVIKCDTLAYRGYGELLGMALDVQGRDSDIDDTIRRWIIDSLFCIGITKTGLCESSSVIMFDETDEIDPGEIYTEIVSLDDFTAAPCRRFAEAPWIGNRVRLPRYQLLDSNLYDSDAVAKLPKADASQDDGSERLSRRNIRRDEEIEFGDMVDVVEVWVRAANAIVTVPYGGARGAGVRLDDYLRVADFYGPKEGGYTFLALTPPVPDNPWPVAPVGIWNDLHVLSNRMASKIIDQADRQRDILGYRAANADDAQEIVDAADGDTIKMEDPSAAKVLSFGGQQRSNEAHLQQLMLWFNLMSGNTEALGGLRENSATATQAEILAANQTVGIDDMKNLVYKAVATEAAKRAWYLHTDPLIEVPLTRRMQIPAEYTMGPLGPTMTVPAQMVDQQIILTPEMRRGDFLDFHFEIQPKSMSRLSPHMRLRQAMEFAIKVIPAAATAAQICMQMGVAFSFPKFVIRMAKEADIEWLDEVFYDPEFQMQMAEYAARTTAMAGSQGVPTGGGGIRDIMQNGQPANVAKTRTPAQQTNRDQQMGAADAQSLMPTNQVF